MSNSSTWPIDGTQSGATTSGQNGPRSDGSEGIHRIHQNSSITGRRPYLFADMHLVYPTTLADWAYRSWRQHPTRHQLYGHLPPITKTIQVRRARHAGHCWRSRDELIRDVLLWTPTHGRAKAGRPARTYIQQLCEDTGCCPEDLPRAMNDREEWRERVRDIHATSVIWWWWWWWWWHSPNEEAVSHQPKRTSTRG